MNGIYYGRHNDGDDAAGAIDNNRVHGFSEAKEFAFVCKSIGAQKCFLYVDRGGGDADLEEAMDECVQLTVKWRDEKDAHVQKRLKLEAEKRLKLEAEEKAKSDLLDDETREIQKSLHAHHIRPKDMNEQCALFNLLCRMLIAIPEPELDDPSFLACKLAARQLLGPKGSVGRFESFDKIDIGNDQQEVLAEFEARNK